MTVLVAALAFAGLMTAARAQDDAPALPGPDGLQTIEPVDPESESPDGAAPDAQDQDLDADADAEAPPPRGANAKPGPVPFDRDAMLAELYAHLAKSESAEQADPVAKTIEGLWLRSGSDTVGLLVRRAMKALKDQKPELALQFLDAVVELAPDYAEGWTRRALVHYLQNDVGLAVGDLRRALALEPNHYKALEGLARILNESGQKKNALRAYQQLLRIHPYFPGAKEAADELVIEVEGRGI